MTRHDGIVPDNLILLNTVEFRMPKLLDDLKNAINSIDNLRLVIIDTWAKVKPPSTGKQNCYDEDYEGISQLKALADEMALAIVLVHHQRKMGSDDIFETLNGSTGLTGAADTILVLQKTNTLEATLHVTGRDVEEQQLAMRFDVELLNWQILGEAQELRSSGIQQLILDTLTDAGKPMKPKELYELLPNILEGTIRQNLLRLHNDETIDKTTTGCYMAKTCNTCNNVTVTDNIKEKHKVKESVTTVTEKARVTLLKQPLTIDAAFEVVC
jgi:hypothetical protein